MSTCSNDLTTTADSSWKNDNEYFLDLSEISDNLESMNIKALESVNSNEGILIDYVKNIDK